MVNVIALARPPVLAKPSCIYGIRALSDPQALPRIADLFAQRGLVPAQLSCRRAEPYLLIDAQIELDDAALIELLLQKIRAMVLVDRANLVRAPER